MEQEGFFVHGSSQSPKDLKLHGWEKKKKPDVSFPTFLLML